jgi:uncharacterized protein YbjT (DUF2867 family)
MILVFGATGTVGREVVSQLVALGEKVRAFARDPRKASFEGPVEIVQGDFDEPDTVLAALSGVDSAFVMSVGSDPLARDRTIAEAVRKAGTRHIVRLSSVAAIPPVDNSYGAAHAAAERALQDSGAAWTVLRPAGFMSNVLQWAWTIKAEGKVYAPYGDIPRALIDPRDIAAVAVKALTTPGHEGRIHTLTGPEALTTPQQVERVAAALGSSLEFIDVPPVMARDAMTGAGMDPAFVDGLLASQADPDPARGATVLPTVEEITGRPAGTLRDWLAEHVSALAG